MNIQAAKHINVDENNRIEYLFVNFDGNDLIAKFFEKEYQMISDEKVDGMFYSIIKLHKNLDEYDLIWHEDVGNYIFSVRQDKDTILVLEQRLKVIVDKLNEINRYREEPEQKNQGTGILEEIF